MNTEQLPEENTPVSPAQSDATPEPEEDTSEESADLNNYRPMTLRVRPGTAWFFQAVKDNQAEHRIGTADAVEMTLANIVNEHARSGESSEYLAQMERKLHDLEEENKKLLALTESTGTETPVLKDNEQIITIDPQVLKLLNNIALNRFNDQRTRERYKLKEQETAGELLLHCILTQEILFNHNACFYTGFTKKQYEAHQAKK